MKVHDYHDGNLQLAGTLRHPQAGRPVEGQGVRNHLRRSPRPSSRRRGCSSWQPCDDRGLPTCSYKGGDPGFVRIVDEATLAFPNYDGNGKYQSMGNLLRNSNVGMLFVDFEGSQRLRIQGVARIEEDDELLGEYAEAQFIVRVDITEVYKNCPRYVHKYRFVEPSEYVPHQDRETPQPAWKSSEELKDALPNR